MEEETGGGGYLPVSAGKKGTPLLGLLSPSFVKGVGVGRRAHPMHTKGSKSRPTDALFLSSLSPFGCQAGSVEEECAVMMKDDGKRSDKPKK